MGRGQHWEKEQHFSAQMRLSQALCYIGFQVTCMYACAHTFTVFMDRTARAAMQRYPTGLQGGLHSHSCELSLDTHGLAWPVIIWE